MNIATLSASKVAKHRKIIDFDTFDRLIVAVSVEMCRKRRCVGGIKVVDVKNTGGLP